jgi:hypothetical protein
MADNLPTSIKNLNTLLGEQLAEGGGGGSSDFSTAKITVTNNAEATLCAPYVVDVDGFQGVFIANSNSGEFDVALYKGHSQAGFVSSTPPTFNVAVTGEISYREGTFFITGDGTITIS